MLGAMGIPTGICCNPAANQNGKQVCSSQAVMLLWENEVTVRFPQRHQKKMLMGGRWRSDETFEIYICIWSVHVVQAENCRPLFTCNGSPLRERGDKTETHTGRPEPRYVMNEELLWFWQSWKPELAEKSRAHAATGNLWGDGALDEVKDSKDRSHVYK